MFEFMLPDPGEGLEEAEIVRWLVAAGDEVKVNDLLLEIETAKSIVELPSPVSGMVQELLVEVGQTVPVGCPIIRIDDGSSSHDDESAGKVETTGPLADNQTVVRSTRPLPRWMPTPPSLLAPVRFLTWWEWAGDAHGDVERTAPRGNREQQEDDKPYCLPRTNHRVKLTVMRLVRQQETCKSSRPNAVPR